MSSFAETKVNKMLAKEPAQFLEYVFIITVVVHSFPSFHPNNNNNQKQLFLIFLSLSLYFDSIQLQFSPIISYLPQGSKIR